MNRDKSHDLIWARQPRAIGGRCLHADVTWSIPATASSAAHQWPRYVSRSLGPPVSAAELQRARSRDRRPLQQRSAGLPTKHGAGLSYASTLAVSVITLLSTVMYWLFRTQQPFQQRLPNLIFNFQWPTYAIQYPKFVQILHSLVLLTNDLTQSHNCWSTDHSTH